MGRDVDLRIYNAEKLVTELVSRIKDYSVSDEFKKRGTDLIGFVKAILERFGSFFGQGDRQFYVLLNNEHLDGQNPYYEIGGMFYSAFGEPDKTVGDPKIDDWFHVFLDRKNKYSKDGISYVDKYEIAKVLGIKLINKDEEDGNDWRN